ncbi:MAG: hypothetical protein JO166_10445 [Deltaproteobacteria bacterium]|nr:hypothetical protein [Deltaproteobacteria bacterium]
MNTKTFITAAVLLGGLAAALISSTKSVQADETPNLTAALVWSFEYPKDTTGTSEQTAAAVRSFRASAEYQEGLRFCVNAAIDAIITRSIADASTAAHCDAFATGCAKARRDDKLDAAARQFDHAIKQQHR